MVSTMDAVTIAARKAIESTYTGTLTILEYQSVRNKETKLIEQLEMMVLENQSCKLSFEKLNSAIQTDTAASVKQIVKLFLAPEIIVNVGSKIIVEQSGIVTAYAASGKPAVYITHQEIILELFQGWT